MIMRHRPVFQQAVVAIYAREIGSCALDGRPGGAGSHPSGLIGSQPQKPNFEYSLHEGARNLKKMRAKERKCCCCHHAMADMLFLRLMQDAT